MNGAAWLVRIPGPSPLGQRTRRSSLLYLAARISGKFRRENVNRMNIVGQPCFHRDRIQSWENSCEFGLRILEYWRILGLYSVILEMLK